MKKIIVLAVTAGLLNGCVSDSDLAQVQSQVSSLQSKVSHLQGQLSRSNEELVATKSELAVVKEQRVVRLPTGAPMAMRPRDEKLASHTTMSDDTKAFNQAVNQYKAGDIQGAISEFEQFIAANPNSQYRHQALFNLGQAAYTSRDYQRAQQALESLVFQPVNGQINQPAAKLLKNIYNAQGNSDDVGKLEEYLRSSSNQLQTQPEGDSTGLQKPSATVVESTAPFDEYAQRPTVDTRPIVELGSDAASEVQKQVDSIVERNESQPLRPNIQ